jgi:hypothetical protein
MIQAVTITALLASQTAPMVARTTWPEDTVRGISGLTHRTGSMYLAAPERERYLTPFEVHSRGISPKPNLPLRGVPEGLDIESIAALDNGDVALGTEAKLDGRKVDKILLASIGTTEVQIKGELLFDYTGYGITAEKNRGVEGLCFTDGRLIAAAEQTFERKNRRYAAIQSYDFREKRWARYELPLTTSTGKISALSCRKLPNAREVFAIERHYEVSRILRFTLPLLDGGGELKSELIMDLKELFPENPPNFEGIERLDDGRFLLISDNDHGGVQGPTHLILASPAPKQERKIMPGAYVE